METLNSKIEYINDIKRAMAKGEFVPYFQPQYNYSTGMIIGAEVLVRWQHPDKGLIFPNDFIPVMEEYGLVTDLDYLMFDCAARHIRECKDKGIQVVPLSVNFSRHDIIKIDYIDQLEAIRMKHNIASKYLKIEITESVAMHDSEYINDIVNQLNDKGYTVEIDDFGSGYSSLNVLKDINFDVIKIDMRFLTNGDENKRAGIILDSVIRMAQWLDTPIIAEGVETTKQADYFKSMGCDYIQGYLFSKPLSEAKYTELLECGEVSKIENTITINEQFNMHNFWDPESLESMMFSNFVGAACILEEFEGRVKLVRVNNKFIKEIGMNIHEKEFVNGKVLDVLDSVNSEVLKKMLDRAYKSGEEENCSIWFDLESDCCGTEHLCIKIEARLIGKRNQEKLYYALVRNVTGEMVAYQNLVNSEKMYKITYDQINIFSWEYFVATKDMHPCFRCMRELGLPALIKNYPEPLIEIGLFPADIADDYREFVKRIDNGESEIEKIYPLTSGHVPFRIHATTEFDENGRPVKAYFSAALVKEDEDEN